MPKPHAPPLLVPAVKRRLGQLGPPKPPHAGFSAYARAEHPACGVRYLTLSRSVSKTPKKESPARLEELEKNPRRASKKAGVPRSQEQDPRSQEQNPHTYRECACSIRARSSRIETRRHALMRTRPRLRDLKDPMLETDNRLEPPLCDDATRGSAPLRREADRLRKPRDFQGREPGRARRWRT